MMNSNVKPGIKTTEFWLTGLVVLLGAVIALLTGYGVLNAEEAKLWSGLGVAVLGMVVPIALAYATGKYAESRARVKTGGE